VFAILLRPHSKCHCTRLLPEEPPQAVKPIDTEPSSWFLPSARCDTVTASCRQLHVQRGLPATVRPCSSAAGAWRTAGAPAAAAGAAAAVAAAVRPWRAAAAPRTTCRLHRNESKALAGSLPLQSNVHSREVTSPAFRAAKACTHCESAHKADSCKPVVVRQNMLTADSSNAQMPPTHNCTLLCCVTALAHTGAKPAPGLLLPAAKDVAKDAAAAAAVLLPLLPAAVRRAAAAAHALQQRHRVTALPVALLQVIIRLALQRVDVSLRLKAASVMLTTSSKHTGPGICL
jgi:hypothetical protein